MLCSSFNTHLRSCDDWCTVILNIFLVHLLLPTVLSLCGSSTGDIPTGKSDTLCASGSATAGSVSGTSSLCNTADCALVCGDGIVGGSEECDIGIENGSNESNCTADCKNKPVCLVKDACESGYWVHRRFFLFYCRSDCFPEVVAIQLLENGKYGCGKKCRA
jgi:hypothetical protein